MFHSIVVRREKDEKVEIYDVTNDKKSKTDFNCLAFNNKVLHRLDWPAEQCCQVFESPKDQNFFPKRPEKTKKGKNIKIGVILKERKFLAFNTGVNLGGMFRHIILVFLTKLCLYITAIPLNFAILSIGFLLIE